MATDQVKRERWEAACKARAMDLFRWLDRRAFVVGLSADGDREMFEGIRDWMRAEHRRGYHRGRAAARRKATR